MRVRPQLTLRPDPLPVPDRAFTEPTRGQALHAVASGYGGWFPAPQTAQIL
jgi:hypothetical protein